MRKSGATGTRSRELTVVICGNPNCGKTSLFNALTGLWQKVGNYPGVTVEKTTGSFKVPDQSAATFRLVDTPGCYSLAAFSPDEYIAAQVLFGGLAGEPPPDLIVCVIDAANLERGLYLLFQIVQVGWPVLVALNMMDVATRHGLRPDVARLSSLLGGIPVVPVVASKGEGVDLLKKEIARLAERPQLSAVDAYGEPTGDIVANLTAVGANGHRSRAEYLRILFDRSGPAEQAFVGAEGPQVLPLLEDGRRKIIERYGTLSAGETTPLSGRAGEVAAQAVSRDAAAPHSRSEGLDRFLLHPLLGPAILVVLMVLMFQAVFSWAAPIMNLIESGFGMLSVWIGGLLPDGPVRSLAVDGLVGGVGSVLVFLPQIIILFLFIAVLEDSGYMPRAAFLVDRLFGWCGLSGKSFLPMLSSFACAVPGIMATRTIENRKLRIMTIMVAPLMSCSARLPVYTIMIAAFIPHRTVLGLFNSRGLVLAGLYLLGLVVAVAISFVLNRLLYSRERSTFMMDMPSYALPTPSSIYIRIHNRVKSFVARAGTVILAITIIIWALSYFPRSENIRLDYERRAAVVQQQAGPEADAALAQLANEKAGTYLCDSYLGRFGRLVAPAFEPLGWDWKITMATLASFPAREVVIATLGTIYNLGADHGEVSLPLAEKMRLARWEEGRRAGEPVFSPAVALSIMVFFALCAQCGATLVTIRQETARWRFAALAFGYMTVLAYLAALTVYQLASGLGL